MKPMPEPLPCPDCGQKPAYDQERNEMYCYWCRLEKLKEELDQPRRNAIIRWNHWNHWKRNP